MRDGHGVIEFGVLGPLELRIGGRAMPLGGRQQRRVLAALLVHPGEVVSTDRLTAVLWGERPPPAALKSLRTHIARLRRTLGTADQLHTRAPGYLLRTEPEHLDAARFERLVAAATQAASERPDVALATLDEALGLWRGPPFAEFADEEFVRAEVTRLEELRLAAAEARFDARLALGEHADLAGELDAFIEQHPLRERPRAQLMLAQYRAGRQLDALAGYRAFRAMLDDEFGVEPTPVLQALEHDILRQSPRLDWLSPPGVPDQRFRTRARIPAGVTSFVGRDDDVAAVVATLDASRLVTLIGTGGIGKTRLAREAAATVSAHYAGGVWWSDLAAVTDPRAVSSAVATNVGAHGSHATEVEDALAAHFATGRHLVVVDNCEHVLDGAAHLATTIVRRCPGTTILATSRTRLGVDGEQLWPVGPLPAPATADPRAAAVQLFIDRARAVRPDFDPSEGDVGTMAEVCRRLDGLPLAIELAAARMRSLNLGDIVARLDDRFRLLADRRRPEQNRHATLRAVLDWSYGLLSGRAQVLFDRLSVFAGGFTLEAAEVVASNGDVSRAEVVDVLATLVDHSMVTTGASGGPMRYVMLETLREYGQQRLAKRGQLEHIKGCHLRYYAALAEQVSVRLRDYREAEAVATLDGELANLRAAQQHAVLRSHPDLAVRVSAALFRYALWGLRDEVFRWAEVTMDLPGAEKHSSFPTVCAMAAWGLGLRGERDGARTAACRGLASAEATGQARLHPLEVLCHVALWEGRLDDCLRLCSEAADVTEDPCELLPAGVGALALTYAGRVDEAVSAATAVRSRAAELGNPSMQAAASYFLGEALMTRDVARSAACFDEAVELAGKVGNRMVIGIAAVSSTSLQARHGTPADALRSFRTVIDHLHAATDWTHLWTGLRSLVELLIRVDSDEAAAIVLAAVTTSRTAPPLYGDDEARLAAARQELGQRLSAKGREAAWAKASAMSDEQLLDFARSAIDASMAVAPPPQRSGDPG